jgi:isocitrate dehydrogenase
VNPVLREGNSDRRAPRAVKEFARKNPHSMAEWSQASRSHVSHMHAGDFYHGEKSMTLDKARDVKMELITKSGKTIVLKPKVSLLDREVIDSMFMSKKALLAFYEKEIEDARKTGVMFSLHVKATMMKVSHPIVFGHCVKIFYKEAFEKHGELFEELGVNVNNGMVDLYNKIATLPQSKQDEIKRDLHACHEHRPELAMVDSAKGITNFHSPNDVIVDASMPAMIRNGGKMWDANGRLKDVKAVMPESTFARIYQEMINFCKWHGAFDPKTMGTVPNVGLMAQQAEEYGSHDKTFEIPEDGVANITDLNTGEVLMSQNVEEGDIWRMCQVKDAAIRDWVKLAVNRARNSGMPVVFWLDQYRPHEAQLITKVKMYLHEHDTTGLDIQIMSQVRAMRYTLERVIRGMDTISATGNILRDYLTDLFPIMELGTSAKMLSIVPADGWWRHVRNRCRRLGAQARAAAGGGKPPALGFAGRIPGAGRFAGRPGYQDRQRARQDAGQDAGCRHRQAAGQQQESLAQDRSARQPRQPVLPGPVLGPGAGCADRGRRAGGPVCTPGPETVRQRGGHRSGTDRSAGPARGHRWLLPARLRQAVGCHASQQDAQRRP